MSTRTFTDDALAQLARAPRDLVLDAVDDGDPAGAASVVGRLEAELAGQMRRYRHWLAAIFAFVQDRHGEPGTIRLLDATTGHLLAPSPDAGPSGASIPGPMADEVGDLVADGRGDDALGCFDAGLARWRAVVDLHRDWISVLLSDVYRQHGADELEALHRAVGEATMDALLADISSPPAERLERFVWLLKGHFSELSLTEEPDRFVITQHPCGTCGRQARDRCHGAGTPLALIDEPHLVSWGRGATTAYRSHVPVWHVAMARERIGVPWPVNRCPPGADDSPCTIVLFKDPYDGAADDLVPR